MAQTKNYDVAVIGGGPAGCVCAMRLAGYGLSTVLLEPGERARQHIGESLPSSIHVILRALGLELPPEAFQARAPEHRVYWGELQGSAPAPSRAPRESDQTSILIWRDIFDRWLLQSAGERGVFLERASVGSVVASTEGCEIRYPRARNDAGRIDCAFVVDATGRAGVLARSHRERDVDFRTLALTAHFGENRNDDTVVESFACGWGWSAPSSGGRRDVTLFLDQAPTEGDRGERFFTAFRSTRHIKKLIGEAPLARLPGRSASVLGVDATPYGASRYSGERFVLVGDAATFIDPLSSHGVHKAMDGALVAAIAARTILERPGSAMDARHFYDEREASIYRLSRDRIRALYRQETRFADEMFWKRRRGNEAATETPSDAQPPPRPAAKPPLRGDMRLRAATGVELIAAPVLEGDYVANRAVLRAPRQERPVRFLGRICLPDLFEAALASESAASAARRTKLGFDAAMAALDWLYREGYLDEAS